MQDFNYYAPTEVVFGNDSEEKVASLIKKYGGTKVLLHYGGQSAIKSGLLPKVEKITVNQLDGGNKRYVIPFEKLGIDKNAKGPKYQHLRLYEEYDGEELKKDYPTGKFCILYDDPIDILNNKDKWEYYNNLLSQKHRFLFAQTLDISRVNDTIILEQVMTNPKYASFRKRLMASEINDNVLWLVNQVLSKEIKKTNTILVKLPVQQGAEVCLETMLLMN